MGAGAYGQAGYYGGMLAPPPPTEEEEQAYLDFLAEQEAAAQANQGAMGYAPPSQEAPPPQDAPPPPPPEETYYPAPTPEGQSPLATNATLPPGYEIGPVGEGQDTYYGARPYEEPPPAPQPNPYIPMGDAANAASIPSSDDQNAVADWYYSTFDEPEKQALVAEGTSVETPPPPAFDEGAFAFAPVTVAERGSEYERWKDIIPDLPPGDARASMAPLPPQRSEAAMAGDKPRAQPEAAENLLAKKIAVGGMGVVPGPAGEGDKYAPPIAQPFRREPATVESLVGPQAPRFAPPTDEERELIGDPYAVAELTGQNPLTGEIYMDPMRPPPIVPLPGETWDIGGGIDRGAQEIANAAAMGVHNMGENLRPITESGVAKAIGGAIAPPAEAVMGAMGQVKAGPVVQGTLTANPITAPFAEGAARAVADSDIADVAGGVGGAISDFISAPGTFTEKAGALGGKAVEAIGQWDRPRTWNTAALGEMAIAEIEGRDPVATANDYFEGTSTPGAAQLANVYGKYYVNDAMVIWAREHPEEALRAYQDGYDADGDGKADFTGGQAVWELFVSDLNAASRTILDLSHDPFAAVPAGRAGLDVAAGVARAAGKPGLAAGLSFIGRAADAASDPLQLGVEAGGPLFRETPRSKAEGNIADTARHLDEIGAMAEGQPIAGEAVDIPNPAGSLNVAEGTATPAGTRVATPSPAGSLDVAEGTTTPAGTRVATPPPPGEPAIGTVAREGEAVPIPPPPSTRSPSGRPLNPDYSPMAGRTWPQREWPSGPDVQYPTWPERGVPGGGEWTETPAARRGESLIPPELREQPSPGPAMNPDFPSWPAEGPRDAPSPNGRGPQPRVGGNVVADFEQTQVVQRGNRFFVVDKQNGQPLGNSFPSHDEANRAAAEINTNLGGAAPPSPNGRRQTVSQVGTRRVVHDPAAGPPDQASYYVEDTATGELQGPFTRQQADARLRGDEPPAAGGAAPVRPPRGPQPSSGGATARQSAAAQSRTAQPGVTIGPNGRPVVAPPPAELTTPPGQRRHISEATNPRPSTTQQASAAARKQGGYTPQQYVSAEARNERAGIYTQSKGATENLATKVRNGDLAPEQARQRAPDWGMKEDPPYVAKQTDPPATQARSLIEQDQHERYLNAAANAYRQDPSVFEGVRDADGRVIQQGEFVEGRYKNRVREEIRQRAGQEAPAAPAAPTQGARALPSGGRGPAALPSGSYRPDIIEPWRPTDAQNIGTTPGGRPVTTTKQGRNAQGDGSVIVGDVAGDYVHIFPNQSTSFVPGPGGRRVREDRTYWTVRSSQGGGQTELPNIQNEGDFQTALDYADYLLDNGVGVNDAPLSPDAFFRSRGADVFDATPNAQRAAPTQAVAPRGYRVDGDIDGLPIYVRDDPMNGGRTQYRVVIDDQTTIDATVPSSVVRDSAEAQRVWDVWTGRGTNTPKKTPGLTLDEALARVGRGEGPASRAPTQAAAPPSSRFADANVMAQEYRRNPAVENDWIDHLQTLPPSEQAAFNQRMTDAYQQATSPTRTPNNEVPFDLSRGYNRRATRQANVGRGIPSPAANAGTAPTGQAVLPNGYDPNLGTFVRDIDRPQGLGVGSPVIVTANRPSLGKRWVDEPGTVVDPPPGKKQTKQSMWVALRDGDTVNVLGESNGARVNDAVNTDWSRVDEGAPQSRPQARLGHGDEGVPGTVDEMAQAKEDLEARLDAYGLQNTRLTVERDLSKPHPEASQSDLGFYDTDQDWIGVKLTSQQTMDGTLDHEASHALRAAGAIRNDEWTTVVDEASRTVNPETGNTFRADAERDYAGYVDPSGRLTREEIIDGEIFAEGFRVYNQNPNVFAPATRSVFDRVKRVIAAIRDTFTGRENAADVFNRIISGEVGARIGQTKSLPPLTDNYRRPLGQFSDTFYRETNLEGLRDLLPNTNYMGGHTAPDMFLSNTPDLARGQGKNTGILVEFEPRNLEGRVNTQKPTWRVSYDNGQAEFVVRDTNIDDLRAAVKAVTVRPDAPGLRVDQAVIRRQLGELEAQGWTRTANPDGSTTWRRPGTIQARRAQDQPGGPTGRQKGADFLARTSPTAGLVGSTPTPRPTGFAAGVRNVPQRAARHFGVGGRVATPDEAGKWAKAFAADPENPMPFGPAKERALDQQLGTRHPERLPKEVVGKRVGQIYLDTGNELRAARKMAQSPKLSAAQHAKVKAVGDKYGLEGLASQARLAGADDADVAQIAAGLSDRDIARLSSERIQNLMGREAGLVGPNPVYQVPVVGGVARVFQALDAYNNWSKKNMLVGWATAPRYMAQQAAFNPITGVIGGHAVSSVKALADLPGYARAYKTMTSGELQPDSPYLKALNRLGKAPNRRDIVQAGTRDVPPDALGGFGVKAPKGIRKPSAMQQAVRAAEWGTSAPPAMTFANAVDFKYREMAGADKVLQAIAPLHAGLRQHAPRVARRQGLLIDANAVDEALRRLEASGTASALDVQRALTEAAGGMSPDHRVKGWARKVAADWDEATGEAVRLAEADATRVFFSGKETNADRVLRRVLSFHYWSTRASRLYLREALRNPALMAAYSRALEWQDKNAHPKWKQFVEFTAVTPAAGWAFFVSPFVAASTAITFADEGEKNQAGMTEAGRMKDDTPFAFAPAFDAIWYLSGKGGREYTPNVGGLRNDMQMVGNVLQLMAEKGLIPGETAAREIAKMGQPEEWFAEQMARFRQWGFERAGATPPSSPVPSASRIVEFQNLVEEEVRTRYETWDAEAQAEYDAFKLTLNEGVPEEEALRLFFENQVVRALNDPTFGATDDRESYYDTAAERQAIKRGIESGIRMVSPFYARFQLESAEENKEIAEGGKDEDATAVEQFALFLKNLDQTTDPRARELLYDRDEYFAIVNEPKAKAAADEWNTIAYGTPDAPITVTGEDGTVYTYGPDDLASLREKGRTEKGDPNYYTRALADYWAAEQGTLGMIRDRKANMDAVQDANPDLAAAFNVSNYAEEYDEKHGDGAFVEDTRKTNPAYDDYMTGLDAALALGEENGGISQEQYDGLATGWEAYAVIQGWAGGPYDEPRRESTGEMAGGVTPMEAMPDERAAYGSDFATTIPEDLAKYDAVASAFTAAGLDPAVLALYGEYDPNVPGSGMPDAAYDQLEIIAANELGLPIRQAKSGNWYFYNGGDDYAPNKVYSDQASDWIADSVYLDDESQAYRDSGYGNINAWLASQAFEDWMRTNTWFDPAQYPPQY